MLEIIAYARRTIIAYKSFRRSDFGVRVALINRLLLQLIYFFGYIQGFWSINMNHLSIRGGLKLKSELLLSIISYENRNQVAFVHHVTLLLQIPYQLHYLRATINHRRFPLSLPSIPGPDFMPALRTDALASFISNGMHLARLQLH